MMRGLLFIVLCLGFTAIVPADEPAKEKSATKEIFNVLGGLLDRKQAPDTNAPAGGGIAAANLGSDQISAGLKEALGKGLEKAIAMLGQTNGFLTNLNVRIPLPQQLKFIEQGLVKIHEEKLADEFVATMNHAAEKAVPVAASVLVDSLKQMSLKDATDLLQSKSPTAATEYFRRTTSTELTKQFLPIIQEATAQTGVTSAYKKFMDKASFGSSFFAKSSLDLDHYVTGKTLDGLFTVVGEEEKRIRENPQARVTELLQKVFGAVKTPATSATR